MTDKNDLGKNGSLYWKDNLRLLGILLFIWFVVSYGFGILLNEELNAFTLPGTEFPLGFWFAQQGAIYIFVILIFFYAYQMDKLEQKHGVAEE